MSLHFTVAGQTRKAWNEGDKKTTSKKLNHMFAGPLLPTAKECLKTRRAFLCERIRERSGTIKSGFSLFPEFYCTKYAKCKTVLCFSLKNNKTPSSYNLREPSLEQNNLQG